MAQDPHCPHCYKPVELLERSDVDALGLPWIKRRELNKRGELKPWAIVRGGKVWIYLKRDVDAYTAKAEKDATLTLLKRLGIEQDDLDENEKSELSAAIAQAQDRAAERRRSREQQ